MQIKNGYLSLKACETEQPKDLARSGVAVWWQNAAHLFAGCLPYLGNIIFTGHQNGGRLHFAATKRKELGQNVARNGGNNLYNEK